MQPWIMHAPVSRGIQVVLKTWAGDGQGSLQGRSIEVKSAAKPALADYWLFEYNAGVRFRSHVIWHCAVGCTKNARMVVVYWTSCSAL